MPENISIRRLQDPAAPEIEQVAAVVSDALYDGTISRWGCGNDKGLFCKLHHCVAADTAVSGHLFAALDDKTGEVVGAITFYEPGKTIFEELQKSQGFNDFITNLPPELWPFWTALAAKVLEEIDEAVGEGGKERTWSVNSFAVRQDYRGKGIGKALLAAGEALAKADKAPVVFETEHLHNVSIYEHLGYNIVQVMRLQSLNDTEFTLFRKNFA